MKPGRNDPCPCGSGKKHKHCCLRAENAAIDSPDAMTWRRIRRAIDEPKSGKTPVAFAVQTYGQVGVNEAWSTFSGSAQPFDAHTPHLLLFMSWFQHHWSPGAGTAVDAPLAGHIPAELYLERLGRQLEPAAKRYIEACVKGHISFHECLRCDPGRGFQSRDLFTGRECYVMERSATETIRAGDLLFGMVVDVDGISLLESVGTYNLPPIRKIEILDFREELLGDKVHCTPEDLRALELTLIEEYLEITEEMLNPRLPELRNTDGERYEKHRVSYDIDSPEQVIRALADLDQDHTADELIASAERTVRGQIKRARWTWQKAGNAMHQSWTNTILGHLEVKSRKLTADVNSARRALEIREIIESRLGRQARFRTDTIQSLEGMTASHARGDPTDAAALEQQSDELAELPEVKAAMQEMMARHFESWVSESIPALDGRTPLECMGDPIGREKVLALVIDAERHARQMKPPVEEAVFQRLRTRLGLPLEQ